MIQQVASTVILSVVALNVASGLALPVGTGMAGVGDVIERDVDRTSELQNLGARKMGLLDKALVDADKVSRIASTLNGNSRTHEGNAQPHEGSSQSQEGDLQTQGLEARRFSLGGLLNDVEENLPGVSIKLRRERPRANAGPYSSESYSPSDANRPAEIPNSQGDGRANSSSGDRHRGPQRNSSPGAGSAEGNRQNGDLPEGGEADEFQRREYEMPDPPAENQADNFGSENRDRGSQRRPSPGAGRISDKGQSDLSGEAEDGKFQRREREMSDPLAGNQADDSGSENRNRGPQGRPSSGAGRIPYNRQSGGSMSNNHGGLSGEAEDGEFQRREYRMPDPVSDSPSRNPGSQSDRLDSQHHSDSTATRPERQSTEGLDMHRPIEQGEVGASGRSGRGGLESRSWLEIDQLD